MRVPDFIRFNPQDYPLFNSPEGEKFLEQLNKLLEPVSRALNGGIGVTNLNCEVKEFEVEEDTEYQVTLRHVSGPVRSVRLLNADLYDYASVAWTPVDQNVYKIRVSFDSAPTSKVMARIVFEGD